VQRDDAEGARRCAGELSRRALERIRPNSARLMPPGPHGVHADDDEGVRRVDGLRRAPRAFELPPGVYETCRERVRDVVVARDGEDWCAEAVKERGGTVVLIGPAAVREIACYHHELRSELGDKGDERVLRRRILEAAEMEVGRVQEPARRSVSNHRRGRLYTRGVSDESPEVFDDLYLGLRAGGALRKKRRGEPLTVEEEEALGRWQRLSAWRKSIAIGAFAVGTFGLGFTLGGLIFGRWRKA
jgi:hypothetical protein